MSEPILRDFPYSFESERLTIRGPLPGDGAEVRTAVLESQEALRPWMPWARDVPDEEAYEAIVRRKHVDFLTREDLQLLLFLKGTHTLVGSSGLHRIDWTVPRVEIGYWVRSNFAGQGYITEAVQAITNFAFTELGAQRIEIRTDEENARSAAVARRSGFVLEATLHHDRRHHLSGELSNTLIFVRLAEAG